MKMTLAQAFDMIERGMTPEEYEKRLKRLRRLYDEKYYLEDAIAVLGDDERAQKKAKRLLKVNGEIRRLLA